MIRPFHKIHLQAAITHVVTRGPLTDMSTTPLQLTAPNWLADLVAEKMGDPTVFDEPTVIMPTLATWARIAVTEPIAHARDTEPHVQVWRRVTGL